MPQVRPRSIELNSVDLLHLPCNIQMLAFHELRCTLDALPKHRMTPGMGGVTNQAARNISESTLPAVLALINQVWRTAELPMPGGRLQYHFSSPVNSKTN